MVRLITRLSCAALLALGLPLVASRAEAQAQAPATTSQPGKAANSATTVYKSRARVKKPVQPEVPETPPPPPTLEQSPPAAPRVSMQNGLLSIDSQNATLAQVLRAVQTQTGASIEVPGSANSERVVAQLGPGRPSDVLNTLLNGTRFNYVILGVTGDVGAVQKVILTPRQGGAAGSPVSSAQNIQPQNPQPEPDVQDEGVPVADNNEDYQNQQQYQPPENVTPPPPGGFRRPGLPNQVSPDQQSYAGPGGEAQAGKTPEQLMQELQQMQQQQLIYQQQLNPANQNPQQ